MVLFPRICFVAKMKLLRGSHWRKISRLRSDIAQVSIVGYLVLISTFFQQLIAARLLGPEQFGQFAAIAAVVGLIEIALVGRSSDLAMRYLGTSSETTSDGAVGGLRRILIVSDARVLTVGYIVLVASAVAASLISTLDWRVLAVLGLTIPAQIGYGANKCSLFMLKSIKPLGNFELIYTLIATGLNVLGITAGGLYGYVVSLAVSALTKNIIAYLFLRREWQRDPSQEPVIARDSNVSYVSAGMHASLGWDGIISVVRNLLVNALSQVDIIILSLLMPAHAVGYYKVGKSLATLPTKIAFPLWRFINPRLMAGLRAGQADQVRSAIQMGSVVLLPITAIVIGIALLWGKQIVTMLYGQHFQPAYVTFVVLLFGSSVLNGFGGWLSVWTVSAGAQRFSICVYAVAVIVQLILGFTLGTKGIVAMAAITAVCMCGAYACFFMKVLRT